MALSTGVKVGIGIGLLMLIGVALFWIFSGTSKASWKEYYRGDIPNYDIESRASGTLDEDKAYAEKLGAKSFLRNSGRTYFKSASSPIVKGTTGDYTLYVLNG